jgi:hypothetical protein
MSRQSKQAKRLALARQMSTERQARRRAGKKGSGKAANAPTARSTAIRAKAAAGMGAIRSRLDLKRGEVWR